MGSMYYILLVVLHFLINRSFKREWLVEKFTKVSSGECSKFWFDRECSKVGVTQLADPLCKPNHGVK